MVPEFFAPNDIDVVARDDGATIVRSRQALLPYANDVGSVLDRWADEAPERVFLAQRQGDEWEKLTYGTARTRVRALASAYLSMGLSRETPIAILSEASLRHAIAALAGMYVGIPVAPISPAYSTMYGDLRRLEFVLRALGAGLVFAEDGDAYASALGVAGSAALGAPRLLVGTGAADGATRFDVLYTTPQSDRVDEAHARIGPDDVAKILFTSGTAGDPKGVVNTHRMLCSNAQSLLQLWPFLGHHPPVLVDWLPWHHTFGGNHNFNIVLFNGGTLYIDDGRPVPGRFARSVRNLADVRPTLCFNVPRGYRLLVDALRADPAAARAFFSNLDLISNAAAALPQATWNELRSLAAQACGRDVPIVGEWGSTETSPMATAVHYAQRNPANIGLPGPGTELLLVPAEHKLEVRVRGPLVTPGYWRRPDLNEAAFDADGFYRMGDALRFADAHDPSAGLLYDGRLAENFKLSTGTWVDVGALRLALIAAAAPLVDEVVVAGADRDEIAVLLFPNLAACRELLAGDDGDVHAFPVRAALAAALANHNAEHAASSHVVARAIVVAEPLSPADGEITDKGSVNQRLVLERRKELVERLYAQPPADEHADTILPARGQPAGAS